jgi:putative ABC transport system substrate-binding protein
LGHSSTNDPQGEARVAAFRQGLQALGWIDGGNLRIDLSWGAGDADSVRKRAAEVMALAPEVVLAAGSSWMT